MNTSLKVSLMSQRTNSRMRTKRAARRKEARRGRRTVAEHRKLPPVNKRPRLVSSKDQTGAFSCGNPSLQRGDKLCGQDGQAAGTAAWDYIHCVHAVHAVHRAPRCLVGKQASARVRARRPHHKRMTRVTVLWSSEALAAARVRARRPHHNRMTRVTVLWSSEAQASARVRARRPRQKRRGAA